MKQKIIRLFGAFAALFFAASVQAQFSAGQILTAGQLNTQFALYVPIAGGTLTGPLTVPTLNTANAAITGGSISGLSSPLPVASGGTGVSTAAAELSRIGALSSTGGSMTGAYSASFSSGGQTFAIGRNSDNSGASYQGLQIGGGDTTYGANGVYMAPDGNNSWLRFQPTQNQSPIEAMLYSTASQGIAQAVSGTNQINYVSGTSFSSAWVGQKFYFNSTVYQVLSVSGTQITVQLYTGGAVSFASSLTDTFAVAYVQGNGQCSVSGTTVTRISGDPFIPFITTPYKMTINGSSVTVTAFVDTSHLTISSSMSVSNVPYTFQTDINDQLVTFRLEKLSGSNEENLSIYARYDGYYLQSQQAGSGQLRSIFLGNPSYTNLAAYANGDTLIGGKYGTDAIRVLAPAGSIANRLQTQAAASGFTPAWQARGSDTNVPMGFDAQGSAGFSFTNNSFATVLAQIGANGSISHLGQEIDKSYTYSTPTTGTTVTMASGSETAIIDPAGTLAALTVTLPACTSAYDGSLARFMSSQAITALTVNATSGTVSNAPTTLAAGAGYKFLCRGSGTKWYPIP